MNPSSVIINPMDRYLNPSSGIINRLDGYLNPSSGIIHHLERYLNPCIKFQIEKSDFSNPSSENEIPPVVSSGIEILLRTSLILHS